ncbi:MAG TPA: aminotransferase class I/II-fold pyridoxal phosphate-dependent enzyme [Actinocrinis sp.]|nr:aminotransferase class I/II-fold pyridoxal phosphate-dependent enzyme [Actinocrinis sp.]
MENLAPPPAAVQRVIAAAQQLHRYPRGPLAEVTRLAAAHLGVDPACVLLTASAEEAVDLALTLAARAWTVHPGHAYPYRATGHGTPFGSIPLGPDWQPAGAPEALGPQDLVILAQPAIPTGNLFDPHWIAAARAAAGRVLIDETYQVYSSRPGRAAEAAGDERLLVYRSLTRGLRLDAVRVGCLVGAPATIAVLGERRRFMSIDTISLNAVAGVLAGPDPATGTAARVVAERAVWAALLRHCGDIAQVRDTETDFLMARTHPGTSAGLAAALAKADIDAEPCDGVGLPGWLRIGVGIGAGDRDRLRAALGLADPDRSASTDPATAGAAAC